jgi:fermentation-respiration switch protein FrsA (DUF1100 family)
MLNAQTYDAGPWAERVSPTPLLMIIGVKDSVIDPDLQRAAFARAGEPKQLAAYDGTHFGAYTEHLEFTAGSAEKWFTRHLTVLPVVVSFIWASCPAGSRHPGRRPGSGGRQCPGRAGWNRRR